MTRPSLSKPCKIRVSRGLRISLGRAASTKSHPEIALTERTHLWLPPRLPRAEGTRTAATINNARIPTTFKNEPSVDFSNPENTRRMRAAIEKVRNELGREYDLVIGGRRVKTEEKTQSLNPAKPSEVVGMFIDRRRCRS